ncbi:linker for activation of T-cells family member 2 isoform X6 [Monodon monoceros]|uniref:linker for activation of T-cells family member 2 isoform X6 n=1 Tax=Monodon monoceros TaxID=40151 RepID=UPI0010F69B4E|nr:linker for activation of T-cells family member 2 isoform X6 [Monodon monoceros]
MCFQARESAELCSGPDLYPGQGGLARAPGGHGLQRGIGKVGRSPYPSPTGGNEVGPRVPTWLSPGHDLAASSDLRAPVLILRALPGGCGIVASRPPGNPGPSPSPSSASAPLPCRKDKLLQFSPSLEDSSSSRYQNFSKGSRRRSDASYIHPFVTDYFDCGQFQKPPEDEDDTNSYENVLICEPKKTESGDEESEGYQNSASIRQWQESRRVVGSPDEDDGEPDYVNGDVAAIKA